MHPLADPVYRYLYPVVSTGEKAHLILTLYTLCPLKVMIEVSSKILICLSSLGYFCEVKSKPDF